MFSLITFFLFRINCNLFLFILSFTGTRNWTVFFLFLTFQLFFGTTISKFCRLCALYRNIWCVTCRTKNKKDSAITYSCKDWKIYLDFLLRGSRKHPYLPYDRKTFSKTWTPTTLKIPIELPFFCSLIYIFGLFPENFSIPSGGSRERFWNCTSMKQKTKFPRNYNFWL